MSKTGLVDQDFKDAAKILDCEIAAIKAVAEVESRGEGFYETGEPKILFERHKFSELTNHIYDKDFPDISSKDAGGYGKSSQQHERLARAAKLDRTAALKSASWGKFQIMGFNYKVCGFKTLQDFINAMYRSEREHLLAFVEFIRQTNLADELRNHRWADFARVYNGKKYKINNYDTKLASAYQKYKK